MTAGALRHRINIEQRSASTDAFGQPVESWSLVAAVWADIRYPTGLSAIKAGADVSKVSASVRIRHRSGIDAGMRIVCSDVAMDIRAVLPDGKREFIDLICQRAA